MIVYLLAFALTIVFIHFASVYYRRIRGERCAPDAVGVRRFRMPARSAVCRTPAQRRADLIRYLIFFLLAFFPLFFVAAVRYDVGTDYFYTYTPNWWKIMAGESPYSEWGFNLLNRVLQWFTSDPQWLFVATSALFTFAVIRTIVCCSDNAALSAAVLLVSCVWFWSLNNVRQAIAVAIMFAAFPFMVNRQWAQYLFCLFFAWLFHWTALLMILPFLVVQVGLFRKYFAFSIVAAVLLLPVVCKAVVWVALQTKYAYFFESDLNNSRANPVNILYHFAAFVLTGFVLREHIGKDKSAYALLCMQFFALLLSASSLLISVSEMIARLTMFFQIYQLLLIPRCCIYLRTGAGKTVFGGAYLLFYGLYMVYYIVLQGYHAVLPYQSIFGVA